MKHHLHPHWVRPDGDNLEKFLNDTFTDLLWKDDAQIAWMLRSKSNTSNKTGRTVIHIEEIPYAKPDYSHILDIIRSHICYDHPEKGETEDEEDE